MVHKNVVYKLCTFAFCLSFLLKLDIDFLAIEDVADGEVEEDEVEGVAERGPLVGCDDGMDGIIDHLGDTDVTQEDGEEFARDIEGKGVDTEDVEESLKR